MDRQMRGRGVLLALLVLCSCGAPMSRQVVLITAGVTRALDQAAATLYTSAAAEARADQQILALVRTSPDGPERALQAYHLRMKPWEALRAGVNVARAADLAAAQAIDSAGRSADRSLAAVTAAGYAVGSAAALVPLLQAAGVPVPPYVPATLQGVCRAARALAPQLPPPCPEVPHAPR